MNNHDDDVPLPFAIPRKEVAVLQVTTRAAEYMRDHLSRKPEGLPDAIRIVRAEDGFKLTLDNPKDDDHIFEREGQKYLLVSPDLGEALATATIDLQQSPHGLSLTITTAPSSLTPQPSEEEPLPSPDAEAKPGTKPDPKPKPKPKTKAALQPEAQPDTEPKPEPDSELAAEPETEPEAESKPEDEPETKSEP